MQQQMKKFVRDRNMYLSKLHNLICKNVSLSLKSRKSKQEWNKICVDSNLPKRKVNIIVKIR
jgi:hypothetical protein